MFKNAERIVSIFANVISISTFFAALFGLVNFDVIPNIRTNNQSSALLLVGLFSLTISYATASVIRERVDEQKQFGGLVVVFCAIYIFMTSFVAMQIVENSSINFAESLVGKLCLVSGLLYVLVHFGVYLAKLSYPNGLTIVSLFFAAFTKGYWIMLGHLFVYLIMMSLLYPMFVESFA
jgi:hypothetical protein